MNADFRPARFVFLIWLALIGLAACQQVTPTPTETYVSVAERPVTEIQLAGPIAASRAEISGMAWCGDRLILVPQYPAMFKEDGQASVFAISRDVLAAYLSDDTAKAIEPEMLPFEAGDLTERIGGFEGFEAVAFHGEDFYVTVEARAGDGMMGYLVKGSVEGDCSGFTLDPESAVAIQPQADLSNMSDETIIIYGDQIHTIYEANGVNVNPNPVAHVFDLDLQPAGELALPNVEYRITDAAVPDAAGTFWAINYFYPGDTKLLPGVDEIAVAYGLGESHEGAEEVERLIALQITAEGVTLAGLPPIYLALDTDYDDSRNWEGLVRFGEGFLLVTDEYPTTILGYVES